MPLPTSPSSETQKPHVSPHPADDMPAIALSGGGAKGDFEVGVVRYLYHHGVKPKILCGTSVGAINALKLAEGEPGRVQQGIDPTGHVQGLAGLEKIWLALRTESDMWQITPKVQDFISRIPALANQVDGLKDDATLIEAGASISFFTMFPGGPGPVSLLGALLKTASDAPGVIANAMALATDIRSADSLATLDPIHATMSRAGSFRPEMVHSSGIKLRLAMVSYEDGIVRYVTEEGTLIERDGAAVKARIPDPKCADRLTAKINAKLDAIDGAVSLLIKAKLKTELAQLQAELANCPKVTVLVQVDLVTAAIASSSIPVVFPAAPIAGTHYVDAGVAMLVPVEAAIKAGATMVYAVAASTRKPGPAAYPADWVLLNMALHVSGDIMPHEIGNRDLFPLNGWGVPVVVIQPDAKTGDIHEGMTIDPGLIRIRLAHGYMRADDVIQAYEQLPTQYLRQADMYSDGRNTSEIIRLRLSIWKLEFAANGKQFVPGTDFPPSMPSVTDAPPNPGALNFVRLLKRALKDLVDKRIAKGGAVPADAETWWMDWEAHNWTPAQALWDAQHPFVPLRTMTVSITPSTLRLDTPVEFTVHATDQGTPIDDAEVQVDDKRVGSTGHPISHTFKGTTTAHFDPVSHTVDHVVVMPRLTVVKAGYGTEHVAVQFAQEQ